MSDDWSAKLIWLILIASLFMCMCVFALTRKVMIAIDVSDPLAENFANTSIVLVNQGLKQKSS